MTENEREEHWNERERGMIETGIARQEKVFLLVLEYEFDLIQRIPSQKGVKAIGNISFP
jgi:hypothetical protein